MPALAEDMTLTECWETMVGTDSPQFREALAAHERDAGQLTRHATHVLGLAKASVKASEAAIAARKELAQALAAAGGEAFAHPELGATREAAASQRARKSCRLSSSSA